jgi:hypothetical protein
VSLKTEIRPSEAETKTAAADIEELPVDLDWQGFLSRCFPGGRRHDFGAVAAYFAYKQLPRQAAADDEVAADAVETWEDEGGSEAPDRREDRVRHVASAPETRIGGRT